MKYAIPIATLLAGIAVGHYVTQRQTITFYVDGDELAEGTDQLCVDGRDLAWHAFANAPYVLDEKGTL